MEKSPEISSRFSCIVCDYNCNKQSEWNKHVLTSKHKNRTSPGILEQEISESKGFVCKHCNKQYAARNSLWYHEAKCSNVCKNEIITDTSIMLQLIKQNDDFKNLLIEQHKSMIEQNTKVFDSHNQILEICKQNTSSIINSNINSNNKTFNLQVFLLEDCKDAMNLSDFSESIKIQLADVEAVGELGYVNGISKLIISNLKSLDVTKRPLHCTDEKREIIYIKECGVWTKDEDYSKLRRLIKCVSNPPFGKVEPNAIDLVQPFQKVDKIVLEATGGGSKCNDFESENKIMKKIAKEITIDKSNFHN